jgi:hypothetical protein
MSSRLSKGRNRTLVCTCVRLRAFRLASGPCGCKSGEKFCWKTAGRRSSGSTVWCTDFALGDWLREHGNAISSGDISYVRALSSELCPTDLVHNLMIWCTDLMVGAPIETIL